MSFYWVNIGKSYKEVEDEEFLWAPSYAIGKTGKKKHNAGWETVKRVKAGDVIFCNRAGSIIFVAVARNAAYPAKSPKTRTFEVWNDDGFRIDVDLSVVSPTVKVNSFKRELMAIHNDECTPKLFAKNGGVSQQYMVEIPDGAGALILGYTGNAEQDVCNKVDARKKRRLSQGGTREVLAQARVGQGQFRDEVLALWKNTCPVTGLRKPELLTASHILKWSLSDDTEKIDPNNGFPLSPAIDKLFDRGYVSFNESGELLFNKDAVSSQDLERLGVPVDAKIKGLNAQQKAYLRRHRVLYHFEKEPSEG